MTSLQVFRSVIKILECLDRENKFFILKAAYSGNVGVVNSSLNRQADGLAAGCEPLTRLRDSSTAKTTRIGDSDSFCFRDGEGVSKPLRNGRNNEKDIWRGSFANPFTRRNWINHEVSSHAIRISCHICREMHGHCSVIAINKSTFTL